MEMLLGRILSLYGEQEVAGGAVAGPLECFLQWSETVARPREWRTGCRQAWGIVKGMLNQLRGIEPEMAESLSEYGQVVSLLERMKAELRSLPPLGALDRHAWQRDLDWLQRVRASWGQASGQVMCTSCARLSAEGVHYCRHCGALLTAGEEGFDFSENSLHLPPGYEQLALHCDRVLCGQGSWGELAADLRKRRAGFHQALVEVDEFIRGAGDSEQVVAIGDGLESVIAALDHMLEFDRTARVSYLSDGLLALRGALGQLLRLGSSCC